MEQAHLGRQPYAYYIPILFFCKLVYQVDHIRTYNISIWETDIAQKTYLTLLTNY